MYYVLAGGEKVNISVPWDLCPNPWHIGNPQQIANARQGYISVPGLRTHPLLNHLPNVLRYCQTETDDAAGHMQQTQTLPAIFRPPPNIRSNSRTQTSPQLRDHNSGGAEAERMRLGRAQDTKVWKSQQPKFILGGSRR